MRPWLERGEVKAAVGAGVLYGIVAQATVRLDLLKGLFGVMSFGYVFALPVVMGLLIAAEMGRERGLWRVLLASLSAQTLCLIFAFVVGWEGSICLLAVAPVSYVFGLLGALFGYWSAPRLPPRATRQWALSPLLLLPLLSAGLEQQLAPAHETRSVHNSIDIDATPQVVWQHIERVAPITEPQSSFFYMLGFPKPIEATLSREAVGGVRHASFERGLVFIETVTQWDPPRQLRFDIEVDPNHTPLTTLDEHVTVGGRYFDVLEGGYRIEPLAAGRVRLHLESRHRISTRFNFYTMLWSDFLMSEIQTNILRVIEQRCEARGA